MSWLNSWIQKLLPRDKVILRLAQDAATNMKEGGIAYRQLITAATPKDFEQIRDTLVDLEHVGDNFTHEMFDELNRSFITPFDRQDLIRLTGLIDDVLDHLHDVSETIVLYHLNSLTAEMREMIQVGCDAIQEAFWALEKINQIHKPHLFKHHMIKIHELENRGDAYFRRAIADLLKPGVDPIVFLKTERVLTLMEATIDRVEDLANIIDSIVIKHG